MTKYLIVFLAMFITNYAHAMHMPNPEYELQEKIGAEIIKIQSIDQQLPPTDCELDGYRIQ
jgi:hypothetical protein